MKKTPDENASDTADTVSDQTDSGHITPASGNLASGLIAGMSEPSEHAIAQAQAESDANVNTPDGFDPSIHEADANGKPVMTPTGRFKKISKNAGKDKPQRKSHLSTGRQNQNETQVASPETIARTSGVGAANLVLAFGVIIGGDEWQPRVDSRNGLDEKAMLESAFGDYFVATGKQDLPPGWALVAALAMYAAPRFTMPKTQSRMQRIKTWAVQKYVAWKMRKRGMSEKEITDRIAKERTDNVSRT